jgi:hypothetical protein
MAVWGWLVGATALAWSWGAAAADLAPCPPAPALEPGIEAPDANAPTWSARAAALKAHRVWSAPRISYGACKRAEIERLGARLNALAGQINALVDEVNALDRKLRTARAARLTAFRAFGDRRKIKPDDWPIAAPAGLASLAPPCPPAPATLPVPTFPEGGNPKEMRRADEAFQAWIAPQDAYLVCRRSERVALAAAFDAAKSQYEAARTDYIAYRSAFNAEVTGFESALARYTAKIPAATPRE